MKRKIIILLIAILIIILLFVIFHFALKDELPINVSTLEEYQISKEEGSSTLSGKGYDVEFVTNEGITKVYIQHQLVYDADNPFLTLDDSFYRYPNTLVFSESGYDTTILYLYDLKENNLFPYSYIDEYDFTIQRYEAKEEGLVVTGTKIMDDSFSIGEETITIDSCEKVNTYGEEIVSGTFLKKYSKKNGFSGFEKVSLKKLKEISKYQELCK